MSSQEQNDRHIIWSDISLDLDDWRESLEELYPGYSDDELYDIMVKSNAENLYDERVNLNIQLSQPIIVIGDLGRWNGRVSGYKMIDSGNIKDCLYSDTDYTEWYVDKYGDLRADAVHHDGTNHYLYRVFKDGVTDTQIENLKIKSITEKPQEPTSHELPKGSAMTLPEFMVFLFQSKDNQTNKRGDENGLQSIDRSGAKVHLQPKSAALYADRSYRIFASRLRF